jgi:AraC-like DNA-binding protein
MRESTRLHAVTGSATQKKAWQNLARDAKYRASDVAVKLGISRRQLQRRIQAAFGCNPCRWLRQQRLMAAPNRLQTKGSVKVVAFEFGFKQVSHFCRVFKSQYGVPPSSFLKNHLRRMSAE